MMQSKPLIFFGTEDFSAVSLKALIDHQYAIAAVITKPDTSRGRSKQLIEPTVKKLAVAHGIPVWQPHKLAQCAASISASNVTLGVLVSYGKIIPSSILDLFSDGIINLHPSLLPRYRGPSPIESAIKHGDSETGVTIMKLVPSMDAGPIYTQATIPLTGRETRPELYSRAAQIGSQLLLQTLDHLDTIQPTDQDGSQASYCQLLSKSDGQLDPKSCTATELERSVRAYLGYPKSHITIGDKSLVVLESRVTTTDDGSPLTLHCRDNTFLRITRLIAPSGKTMNADDFERGLRANPNN